jgi:hypothetical protein
MTATYEKIATNTLGSSQSSVTFSSISGAYTDLVIIIDGISSDGGELRFRFNSDSSSNYSFTQLYGTGSSAGSARDSNRTYGRIGSTRTSQNTIIGNIMNYSNNTTYKTIISRDGTASAIVQAFVNLWRSTSAITQIVFTPETGTFSSGMVFTIYGIKSE